MQDRSFLLPVVGGLSERQARLFLMMASLIVRHEADMLRPLTDGDMALAAEALAATLETSMRGIVYDHRAATVPADRLLAELKALVAEITKEGGSALERDAAIALRRIEAAARTSIRIGPGRAEFHQLLVRMLGTSGEQLDALPAETAKAAQNRSAASPLIIP
jgi:hypothetical protein